MLTSRRFWITTSLCLLSVASQAFMTPVGRVIRSQPERLSHLSSFRSEGTLRYNNISANYVLNWVSPGVYEILISGLPATIYSNSSVASPDWKITRIKSKCLVKTSTQAASCGGPGLWGTLELGGRVDAVVEALLRDEIVSAEMAAEPVVDSKDPSTTKVDPHEKLVVGKNHGLPTAFIEIEGRSVNRDSKEQLYPVIQYDQTFLAPRLLRVKSGDDIFTVEANGELDTEKELPRWSYILSDKLVIRNQKDQQVSILRKSRTPLPSKFQFEKEKTSSLYDLSIINDALTFEGQFLLSALLFAH